MRVSAFAARGIDLVAIRSLVFIPQQEVAAAFALRCVVHMLGRALCAGSPRDDAVAAWLMRSIEPPSCSAYNADPGTRLFVAARRAERRMIAKAVRRFIHNALLRLAWVRAAERGDPPNVAALDTAHLRAVAVSLGPLCRGASCELEKDARERALVRRGTAARPRRIPLRAGAALYALRTAQGEGEPSLWQHAAFLPRFDDDPSLLAAFLPYEGCYFAPTAAAARVAEAAKAAAAPARARAVLVRRCVRLCRVVPSPPPEQAQPRVTLLVGDMAFADVPTSWLAASPFLADLLSVSLRNR